MYVVCNVCLKQIRSPHPSIWKLINALRKETRVAHFDIVAMERGDKPPNKKKKYINLSLRIAKIVQEYNDRDQKDYLRALAYNFSLY